MSSRSCRAMLRDKRHLFRRMWAAEMWSKMGSGPDCWAVRRDAAGQRQSPRTYFEETKNGAHCDSNWYEVGSWHIRTHH